MVTLPRSSPLLWLCLVLLHLIINRTCASIESPVALSLQLPSGRVLSLSAHTFQSLHPHSRQESTATSEHLNLSTHIFELIHTSGRTVLRNLHGTEVEVWRILKNGEHISVPSLSDTRTDVDVDPDVWSLDGVSIVTLRTEILGVWSENISLLPLDQLQYSGVYIHQGFSSPKSKIIKKFPSLPHPFSSSSIRQQASHLKPCLDGDVVKEVEVALAYDHLLCSKYGSSKEKTDAAVRAALEIANLPYVQQTCLRLRTVNVTGECDAEKDPYKGFDELEANGILDAFAKHWWTHHLKLHRDMVLFLPGFRERQGVSGVAFIGAACSQHHGMAWGEQLSPLVMAHEIGHLLSATHSEEGVMKEKWNSDDKIAFSDYSITQISNFIDVNPASKCITVISQAPDEGPSNSPKAAPQSPSPTSPPSPTSSPSKLPSSSAAPTVKSSIAASPSPSKSVSMQPSSSAIPKSSSSKSPKPSSIPSVSKSISTSPSSSAVIIISDDGEPSSSPSVSLTMSVSPSPLPTLLNNATMTPPINGTATQTANASPSVTVSMTYSQTPNMSSPHTTISSSESVTVSVSAIPQTPKPSTMVSPQPTTTVSATSTIDGSENDNVNPSPISNATTSATPSSTPPLTCLTGWNRWNLLRCTGWRRLATRKIWIASGVNNTEWTTVSMNIVLRQEYGEFRIRYRVFNSSWIRSIGVMLTMANPAFANVSITGEEIKAVRVIRRDVRSEHIKLIPGWKTCCRKRMRIYTQVRICRIGVCKTELLKLGFKVQCRTCGIPRVFEIPYKRTFNSTELQPIQRRCPLCARRRSIS